MIRRFLPALLIPICLPCAVALADVHDDYRAGLRAFKAGDYRLALKSFETSADAGMRTPTLDYNLGVVHYKLGNLTQARESFARLTDDSDWGAIAQYNLGLIAEKRGDERSAAHHYRFAVAETNSEKVRRLANAKLGQQIDVYSSLAAQSRWNLYASVGTGFDDNVTLTDVTTIDVASEQEDYFVETVGVASRYFAGDVRNGWRLDLGGYYRANADLDDFDVGSGVAGATYNRALERWHLQAGVRTNVQTVGSEHFTTGAGIRLSAYRSLGKMGLRVTEELNHIDGAGDYKYLTGMQNRARIELSRQLDQLRWGVAYEYETNDRDDLTFVDEFFSYSPSMHRAVAEVHYAFSDRLSGELQFDVRSSSYDDENVEVSLDGTVEQAERDETRFGATARLARRFSDTWQLFGEYQYTDNDANFDRYAYSSNRYLLGIELTH